MLSVRLMFPSGIVSLILPKECSGTPFVAFAIHACTVGLARLGQVYHIFCEGSVAIGQVLEYLCSACALSEITVL